MRLTDPGRWFILRYEQLQEIVTVGKISKIAISLPEDVLAAVEMQRQTN